MSTRPAAAQKAEVQFEFLVNKDKKTISIRRVFAGTRQLVWDCHTQSELLDRWFAPRPLTTKTRFMDFSEGGHWLYAMVEPGGQEHVGRMDYLTIRPIDGYTSLDGFCDDSGTLIPALPQSTWNVTFSDLEAGTLAEAVVSYASAEALEQAIQMGLEEGMVSTMERLDELLLTFN